MSQATKENAIDKLDNIGLNIMYPDKWYMDCIPDVTECKTLVEFVIKAQKGLFNLKSHLIGTSDVFSHQICTAHFDLTFVNALYSPNHNVILIYPALFLPPLVPENVSEAYEYAAFTTIGHELTHAFDDSGAQYDKYGNKNNWWTVADKMEFEERQKLLVDCYNHLEGAPDILPGKYANGTVTLEENIADLGGLNIALDAYTEYLQEQGYFGSVLEDQQRKFFESYADIWSCKYGEEYIKDRMDGKRPDSHALPQERINGVVMNMDIWYKLYNVTRENKLYLPPEKRTRIW